MASPLPPIIVNGVVFTAANRESQKRDSSAGFVRSKSHAPGVVLYALDGTTGKILWQSKDPIRSSVRGLALSAGGGNVYLITKDNILYSFGFPMDI